MSTLEVSTIQPGSGSTANLVIKSTNGGRTVMTANSTVSSLNATRIKEDWTIVNSNNVTLEVGRNYAANTRAGALTLNLPSSASIGDVITVIDHEGLASTANNVTIAKNGNRIDGFERNAILNVNRGGVKLVYVSSTVGWMSDKKEQETQVHRFQGEVSGYTSGGSAPPVSNVIDKFPFATDINATDVGDLSQARDGAAGQSSSISGYTSGGYVGPFSNVIDKFPFTSDNNATDIGDLTLGRYGPAGQSSTVSGYASGGNPVTNIIEKFPFSSDANSSDVGDLTQARFLAAGQSSIVNGYTSGGYATPNVNTIDKFPFASDANATDVGDLSQIRRGIAGQSSLENGYASGGLNDSLPSPTNRVDVIDKFPFASDVNATDTTNLTQGRRNVAGQSSTVSGYSSGGDSPPFTNVIDKFPFTSDGNATDVGDLTQTRERTTGQQV